MARLIDSRLFIFMIGIAGGFLLAFILVGLAVYKVPSWLVLDETVYTADAVVVLGGGGGSRLRKGLSLYDEGLADRLLLVGRSKRDWRHIIDNLCADCEISGKDVVMLEGSRSTFTDAELVADYISQQSMDRLLVVTDPYHTRRASMVFGARFRNTAVAVSVVSSGDYAGKPSPNDNWWMDRPTSSVIWAEVSKILFMFLKNHELLAD